MTDIEKRLEEIRTKMKEVLNDDNHIYFRMPSVIREAFDKHRFGAQTYDLNPQWGKANLSNFYALCSAFWAGFEKGNPYNPNKYIEALELEREKSARLVGALEKLVNYTMIMPSDRDEAKRVIKEYKKGME